MLQASSTSPVLVEALCGGTEITTRGTPIANQPFYPVNSCRPRPFLSFARFDNDPELLSSIQDLNIPVLKNAVWRLNNDGELCGGFSYIERASWNNQDVAVKFLRGAQTVSGQNRGERVGKSILTCHQLDRPCAPVISPRADCVAAPKASQYTSLPGSGLCR